MNKDRVKVQDPFTKAIIEVDIPVVVVCGTYEDCCVMLILSPDPTKCAKFRGNLANEPELSAYLKESGHEITQIGIGPDGVVKLIPSKMFC